MNKPNSSVTTTKKRYIDRKQGEKEGEIQNENNKKLHQPIDHHDKKCNSSSFISRDKI